MAVKPKAIPAEIVKKILDEYQSQTDDRMGLLYNRFVGFISEARLPLTETITVLTLLLKEATEMAEKKYKGG
jgi:hypothetical protein